MKNLGSDREKLILVFVCIVLNFVMFSASISQMTYTTSDWAKDFSAYYQGAYRLIHNPTQIYTRYPQPGDYNVGGISEFYKYTPSFLLLMLPFQVVNYQNALIIFNLLQLLLIPVLAYFVYRLVKNENRFFSALVIIVVLLQPLPFIVGGGEGGDVPFTFGGGLFCSYMFAWINANAHILQTVLLIGSIFFLVSSYHPLFSAVLFSFGCFDPRMAFMMIPVLLYISWKRHSTRFILYSIILLIVENLPFFFYNSIGQSFILANLNFITSYQLYAYEWIPIYSIILVSVVVIRQFKVNRDVEKKNQWNKIEYSVNA